MRGIQDVPRLLHASGERSAIRKFNRLSLRHLFRGAQPILQPQALDPGEFSFVVGDNHVTKR
jgi:hypothetical protein